QSTRTVGQRAASASASGPRHAPVCAKPCTSPTVRADTARSAPSGVVTVAASVVGVACRRTSAVTAAHRRLTRPMDPEHAHPSPADGDPPDAAGDVAATFCDTLVDEWVGLGMTDVVVSPGSRSTPLALAAASEERLRVHVHHDERSASFTALGLASATRRPAAVVCTSGTAAVQFHAAVVEAHEA